MTGRHRFPTRPRVITADRRCSKCGWSTITDSLDEARQRGRLVDCVPPRARRRPRGVNWSRALRRARRRGALIFRFKDVERMTPEFRGRVAAAWVRRANAIGRAAVVVEPVVSEEDNGDRWICSRACLIHVPARVRQQAGPSLQHRVDGYGSGCNWGCYFGEIEHVCCEQPVDVREAIKDCAALPSFAQMIAESPFLEVHEES